VLAVIAGLGSALCYALASVLQQRAAAAEPLDQSMRIGLLARLVRRPLWIAGMAADVLGFVLQFVALGHGSLVLVQPLLVSGLLFALPLGALASGRRMERQDWMGSALVVAGLSIFLVVGNPGHGRAHAKGGAWVTLAIVVVVLCGALLVTARRTEGSRRAILLASAGGVLYGFTAALTKSVAHLLDRGLLEVLSSWQTYALITGGVLGLVVTQSAFQAAPLVASLPMLTVVDPLASIAIGAFVFHEHLASSPAAVPAEAAGLAALVAGVFVLARSPLLHAGVPAPPGGKTGP
jgi:drug/metabolite transporter (DMT)-like permease